MKYQYTSPSNGRRVMRSIASVWSHFGNDLWKINILLYGILYFPVVIVHWMRFTSHWCQLRNHNQRGSFICYFITYQMSWNELIMTFWNFFRPMLLMLWAAIYTKGEFLYWCWGVVRSGYCQVVSSAGRLHVSNSMHLFYVSCTYGPYVYTIMDKNMNRRDC